MMSSGRRSSNSLRNENSPLQCIGEIDGTARRNSLANLKSRKLGRNRNMYFVSKVNELWKPTWCEDKQEVEGTPQTKERATIHQKLNPIQIRMVNDIMDKISEEVKIHDDGVNGVSRKQFRNLCIPYWKNHQIRNNLSMNDFDQNSCSSQLNNTDNIIRHAGSKECDTNNSNLNIFAKTQQSIGLRRRSLTFLPGTQKDNETVEGLLAKKDRDTIPTMTSGDHILDRNFHGKKLKTKVIIKSNSETCVEQHTGTTTNTKLTNTATYDDLVPSPNESVVSSIKHNIDGSTPYTNPSIKHFYINKMMCLDLPIKSQIKEDISSDPMINRESMENLISRHQPNGLPPKHPKSVGILKTPGTRRKLARSNKHVEFLENMSDSELSVRHF